MDRAENIHETDVFHFGSPSHPYTLEVLARELAVVAANAETAASADPAAAPAPVRPEDRGEWDFLKPVSRLASRPAPP
jgi:hypothetical protein